MPSQICGACGGKGQVAVHRQGVYDEGVTDEIQWRWCSACEGTGRIEEATQ